MRLLDLYCGGGGAAMGYHRAGFDVVGVDINQQPHYPFEFHQADAMTFPLDGFDAIHASPPCQAYSTATGKRAQDRHADLYAPTRDRLVAQGKPYVIENVIGAPYDRIILCGSMFDMPIRRHRNFETSWFVFQPPCSHKARPFKLTGVGGTGDYKHSLSPPHAEWPAIMGMPWADWREVGQAIPPAYTEWIGRQLVASLEAVA